MNAGRDVERLIADWFVEEAVLRAPDHVLESAGRVVDRTKQRRPGVAWREWIMSAPMRVGAAVAIGALAIGGALFFLGRSGDTNVGGPGQSASPSATPTPSPAVLTQGPLAAGAYTAGPSFPVSVSVTVPDGWEGLAVGRTLAILQSGNEDGAAYLGFWIAQDAQHDPCHLGGVADSSVGPTARDLAQALAGAPGFEASGPTDTSVDGLDSHFVELTGPLPGCTEPELWLTPDGSCRCVDNRVERNRLWILDVDGVRLVIDALDIPPAEGVTETSADDLADLQDMIDSIRISR